ncbi:acyltransferase [Beijerinckia sp. L45]|uniref:acyltransferase family protein n=1 Tax=Beijerinckia sp. L45 TaxID=1641855 RepID=UPI00131A87A8|nr:acyltransferase [Beijerinckia sp. L45]
MAQIRSIQALRAGAALLVTLGHLEHEAASLPSASASGFAPILVDLTGAGVDLFFVISGFVMVYASHDLFARPQAARLFLTRRIARIVPIYWLVTSLFLVVMAGSHVLSSAAPTFGEIVKSYLFIPYLPQGGDMMQPVYKLGWTLNYEMFFYVVFTGTLVLPQRAAVAAIAAAFSALVALGLWLAPAPGVLAFWSHPIVLEFVLGAVVALAYRDGLRFPPVAAGGLLLAGLCGFAATTLLGLDAHGLLRPLLWGLPAALIFVGSVLSLARLPSWPVVGWLVGLGDASYAIYLLHPLIVRGLRVGFDKTHASDVLSPWVFIALGLTLVVPLAMIVHRGIERPLTRRLSRLFGVRPTHLEAPPRLLDADATAR